MNELSETPPPLPPPPESDRAPDTREALKAGWWFWALLGGASYGLLMRLAFGLSIFHSQPGGSGVMLVSFLLLVPFLIGLWTVWQLPESRRKWSTAFLLPWAPTAVFLGGTAILAIEGSICIVLAMPIFLALASLGGLVAFLVIREKPSLGTTSAILMLPLATGLYEQRLPLPDAILASTESIHIAAPPERIWQLINDAEAIEPAEMASGWAWRIGVPYPVSALTVDTAEGRVRKLRWQHDVHFDEPILDWAENRYIRWSYRFAADSIPPGALDEHVTIGGRYFDLVDTSYRLEPEDGGTRLAIVVHYRISTRFNWYAGPLGRWMVDDAARTILAFYQRRAQAPAGGRTDI